MACQFTKCLLGWQLKVMLMLGICAANLSDRLIRLKRTEILLGFELF